MFFNNKSIRRLRLMIEAIRSRDFTLHFSTERLRGEERRLAEEVNAVISEFRNTLMRQEAMYGQFATLLDQVSAALIVDDGTGRVMWMNRHAIDDLCGFRIAKLEMLASIHPTLPDTLNSLKPGEQRLVTLNPVARQEQGDENPPIQKGNVMCGDVVVSMTQYFRQGDMLRLFSIENMQFALMQNEIEVQKKLVSVLTHEMMNSLAPIISLSETLAGSISELTADETQQALQAIRRRSEGLLNFVDSYHQLARISLPRKEAVMISDLVSDLQTLFSSPHIVYDIEEPSEVVNIDRNQMTQVLINMLKNAQEACHSSIRLSTRADRPRHHFYIAVSDDGDGIRPEVMERIFVPFFTTKAGGTGIGLCLCRQIVSMHGGRITVDSQPGNTVFTISLDTKTL